MQQKEALDDFRKRQILEAAKALFLEKGFASATMDELAARAGCSKSTVYVYFAGKEDVRGHLMYQSAEMLCDGVAGCVRNGRDFRERYFAVCGIAAFFQRRCPMYFDYLLGFWDRKDTSLPVYRSLEERQEQLYSLLRQMFLDAGDCAASYRQGAEVFWAGLCGLISWHAGRDPVTFQDESLRSGFEFLLKAAESPAGQPPQVEIPSET